MYMYIHTCLCIINMYTHIFMNFQQVVHALNSHMGKKRSVHISGFITLSKDFPILLFPVFELLRNSRKNTLGEV
jgi:uncharacterized protein YhhL (DUF1145 family)